MTKNVRSARQKKTVSLPFMFLCRAAAIEMYILIDESNKDQKNKYFKTIIEINK